MWHLDPFALICSLIAYFLIEKQQTLPFGRCNFDTEIFTRFIPVTTVLLPCYEFHELLKCCSMNTFFLIGGCCVLGNSCNLISQTCESYRVMGEPVNFFKSSSYLCDGVVDCEGSVDGEKETEVQRERGRGRIGGLNVEYIHARPVTGYNGHESSSSGHNQ
ncbi:hypothetical protein T07_6399 [Trichinella nelsoni]|uniref:Uncharacterized protein n=1 Tax=Trichinella nelsoni TaxID=6336 RepID=A0A0V0SAE6_9BILA|nr:hypothetical protein T07_6399 [Trichinella nelsoni]